jgi:hypothetical protein
LEGSLTPLRLPTTARALAHSLSRSRSLSLSLSPGRAIFLFHSGVQRAELEDTISRDRDDVLPFLTHTLNNNTWIRMDYKHDGSFPARGSLSLSLSLSIFKYGVRQAVILV